jgi:hypothetical protein
MNMLRMHTRRLAIYIFFFSNYTVHRRHLQHTHTHPYEYTHVNPTPRSIFEDCASKPSRLTKSPQASRCRRERHLPLKAQTTLNPEKFALTESRTQDLRCYKVALTESRTFVTTRLQSLDHLEFNSENCATYCCYRLSHGPGMMGGGPKQWGFPMWLPYAG